MKIIRNYALTKVEITLTEEELLEAYLEKEKEYNKTCVLDLLDEEDYTNVPDEIVEKIVYEAHMRIDVWSGDFTSTAEGLIENYKAELAQYKRKQTKYRSFNISYVAPDGRHDITQLDVVDGDQTAMYAELFNLFEKFCRDEYLETCKIEHIQEARYEDD